MELGSYTSMDHLAAELFLKSCFSDSVFVTLFCTAGEMAVASHWRGPHLLNSVVLVVADSLFGVLAVADGLFSLFGSECWDVPDPPPPTHTHSSPSPISHMVSVDI